jgi:hypothetical protein
MDNYIIIFNKEKYLTYQATQKDRFFLRDEVTRILEATPAGRTV